MLAWFTEMWEAEANHTHLWPKMAQRSWLPKLPPSGTNSKKCAKSLEKIKHIHALIHEDRENVSERQFGAYHNIVF